MDELGREESFYGDEKRNNDIEPVSSTIVILGAMVSGIGGVALQTVALSYQTGSFFQYGTYILRVFNQQDYVGLALQVSLLLGFAVVVASVVVGALALYKKRFPVAVALFILILLSLAMTGFGGALIFLSSEIDKTVQSTAQSTGGDFASEVSDYLLALYTECCEARGLLVGGFDTLNDCLTTPPTSTTTCYRDEPIYTYYRRTANAWVCSELEAGIVNLEGVLIPNTQFEATILTQGRTEVPVVGLSGAPTFGCGTGKALAFQYAFYVWFDQAIQPIALTSLICGILQLLFLFCGCATICIGNVDDELNGLSMFQETNPYNQPSFDPEKERQARQLQIWKREQERKQAQQAQAQERQVAAPVIARLVPRDVDDKI